MFFPNMQHIQVMYVVFFPGFFCHFPFPLFHIIFAPWVQPSFSINKCITLRCIILIIDLVSIPSSSSSSYLIFLHLFFLTTWLLEGDTTFLVDLLEVDTDGDMQIVKFTPEMEETEFLIL